jgi:uncharacterized protein YxjI
MAAQFCMKCGKPLPEGAQFCSGCGNPVTSTAPLAQDAQLGPTPPPLAGVPAAGPPLTAVLGLQGGRSFLLQHQLTGLGQSYRVLNPQKDHLFTVKENVGQEMRANFLGGASIGGVQLGHRTFLWTVHDAAGAARGSISFEISGFHAVSTLADAGGTPLLVVNVDRGFAGGLTATAAYPDGRPMLQTKGNLIRHNFSILDGSGIEVAKIHEAMVSVRDTYNLDLVGAVDPLYPLIFAILIDREKGK